MHSAKNAAKELKALRKALEKHDSPMSDVNVQAEREIGFLSRISISLNPGSRALLLLRPKKSKVDQLLIIREDLSDSIYDYMRKYGKNDIYKLKDGKPAVFQEALSHYNRAMDLMLQVLELKSLLHEVKTRKGLHENYLSLRSWEIVKIVITAVFSLIVGYLIGDAKK
jgi:hypothetical protein